MAKDPGSDLSKKRGGQKAQCDSGLGGLGLLGAQKYSFQCLGFDHQACGLLSKFPA